MKYPYPALPELTVNHSFMVDFVTADTPCFAMGLVEEGGIEYGFLGFRPNDSIPRAVSDAGFSFGHTLLGDDTFEVIHFAFKFYGYQNYNVLLNPNNSLVRKVLQVMLAHQNYFFFALDTNNGNATAFRAEIEQDTLRYLRVNQSRLQSSQTTDKQYDKAVVNFSKAPAPEGIMLNWVCRDKLGYLDLSKDRMTLNPAS
jgi:hypothetical protein